MASRPLATTMPAAIDAAFGAILVTTDSEDRVQAVDLAIQAPKQADESPPQPVDEAFQAYLEGRADHPEVALADVDVTAFQHRVLTELTEIAPGQPVTYGELARRIGKPGAARAVGQALRCNPAPLVWPCHRVVACDGLGGFGGARGTDTDGKLAIKRWLLAHEAPQRARADRLDV
jgi:methylated-DNA-[protein]-cysteine S-methyltransferase